MYYGYGRNTIHPKIKLKKIYYQTTTIFPIRNTKKTPTTVQMHFLNSHSPSVGLCMYMLLFVIIFFCFYFISSSFIQYYFSVSPFFSPPSPLLLTLYVLKKSHFLIFYSLYIALNILMLGVSGTFLI